MVSLVKDRREMERGIWNLPRQRMNTNSSWDRKYHRQKELCDVGMGRGCEEGEGEGQWGRL